MVDQHCNNVGSMLLGSAGVAQQTINVEPVLAQRRIQWANITQNGFNVLSLTGEGSRF